MPDNAATLALSAQFTAVAHGALPDGPLRRGRRSGHHLSAQRLHEAAAAEVLDASGGLSAAIVLSLCVLAGYQWWFGSLAAAAWTLALLAIATGGVLLATWRTTRRLTKIKISQRQLLVWGMPALLLLATLSWTLGPDAPAAGRYLAASMIICIAFTLACGFAPLKSLALGAAALPLSPAVENLRVIGSPESAFAISAACALASATAGLLVWFQHRRWRNAMRAAFDREEQLRELEAARDAANRADAEKSRFLAIASHDLRQPVHAIGLFAATLEKRLDGTAEGPLVRNLNRAIDGLDQSFSVMLDISRLDAGAVEPRVQQFPLRDLFRRLHMHYAGLAEEKGLGLRFSPGGKSISSDPQLLERVLGNLVQNAIKYTERGGILVVARSTQTHTHVEIWDTGVGIQAAELPKVFEEFYQVGRGERVRSQGLGMGLAIVKRLVRLLGHELTVSSRPGRGTMFRLRIARGDLPDIQELTAAADTLPMPLLNTRTVLVLDDEQPIREGLCMLLQEWGYDAIAAGSIAEAERAVDQMEVPPDLILSDLHLGEGPDGIAGIEAIRRRCPGEVAAILITGDTSHAEIRRATESGHPVLFKPVQTRKLYNALRDLGS